MPRLPKAGSGSAEYSSFTSTQWHNHDAFYAFWVERWKRVVDYLRSLHWRVLQEVDLKQIPEWHRFPIENITLSIFNDYVGQFLQSRVRWSAVPDREDAIASAELADGVLKYLWDKLGMDQKKTDLAAWLAATGNADLRVFWNTSTGDQIPFAIPDPNTGLLIPVNPQTFMPDPSMKEPIMVDAGEIGVEVVAPQLVRYPMNKYSGVMIGFLTTYDEAVEKYGDQIAETLSYQTVSGPLTTDLMSVFPQTLSSGMPAKEPAALLIEHYIPRSSRYPRGLWWTAADNKVMVTQPQDLPAKHIPNIHFRWIPLPGHPSLGLSPLYDITWSNKHYEELLARKLEWLSKVVPKLVRKTGDGLSYGEFSDEPGQEVVVNVGAEPSWMAPQAFPEQFTETQQGLMDDIMTVGGYKFQRRDQGQPQAGDQRQGFRVPLRTKNEGEQMMLAIINAKSSWEHMGYVLLDYVAKFYTEPRTLAIVGADKSYMWKEFVGSDLENLQASLHVDELSLYSWNRQALRDTVIGIMNTQAGAVLFSGPDGQPDRDRIDAAMNATGIDVAQDVIDPDILEARNENNAFQTMQFDPQTGQPTKPPPQVQPWNKDETHMAEHSKVPKSIAFKGWPQPAQQAFLQHMSGHEQRMQQAQQGQQQAMLDQEKQLREIRGDAETKQAVKTKLGEDIVDALVEMLMPKMQEKKTPFGGKKSES